MTNGRYFYNPLQNNFHNMEPCHKNMLYATVYKENIYSVQLLEISEFVHLEKINLHLQVQSNVH